MTAPKVTVDDDMVVWLMSVMGYTWEFIRSSSSHEKRAEFRRGLETALNPPPVEIAYSMVEGEIIIGPVSRIRNGSLTLQSGKKLHFGSGLLTDFDAWCKDQIAAAAGPRCVECGATAGSMPNVCTACQAWEASRRWHQRKGCP